MHHYQLSSTEQNSNQYGVCDVCGKRCTEVFYQTEEKDYFNSITKKQSRTYADCVNHFGHKECLMEIRKNV